MINFRNSLLLYKRDCHFFLFNVPQFDKTRSHSVTSQTLPVISEPNSVQSVPLNKRALLSPQNKKEQFVLPFTAPWRRKWKRCIKIAVSVPRMFIMCSEGTRIKHCSRSLMFLHVTLSLRCTVLRGVTVCSV